MTDKNSLAFLGFNLLYRYIGPSRYKNILSLYDGDVEQAWNNRCDWPFNNFFKADNLRQSFKKAVTACRPDIYLEQLKKNSINFVTLENPLYPEKLKELVNPPIIIYFLGDLSILRTEGVAVVGSRLVTPYGRMVVNKFVPYLAKSGFSIVSGLAFGVDALSHKKALDCGGTTVAVLPAGVDNIAPRGNYSLFREIITSSRGLVVSEFPLNTVVSKWHFPYRSRIVVALSRAVLIVEASEKSGTRYTAKEAIVQNKPLFSVPGPIDSPFSVGSNRFIQQGGSMVIHPSEILSSFGKKKKIIAEPGCVKNVAGLSLFEQNALSILNSGPLVFDDLLSLSKMPGSELRATLTILEVRGMVKNDCGIFYRI